MEIDKVLKHVNNLNEYISISQRVLEMPANSKIHFNMSTVLSLKKVRALEIEYFNKCEGSGAALLLFERMVELPPSKTWVLLGRELVSLLQYWLDAMRKHLVKHNHNWWNFLKILLKFIKHIRVKDACLPNMILENTAECLLDLATGSEPDVQQRLEILVCLNLCCGESSRETRISLREKLDNYLTKLSLILARCGHWPTQYSVLENLMRWLVPRHNLSLRQAAAAKWVPEHVFGQKAVCVFMERAWQNFYQDARDFLNAYNNSSDLVVSVLCRKAAVGSLVLLSGTERRESWLDINSTDKSVSMVVPPTLLQSLGQPTEVLETLILPDEIIHHMQISKESSEVVVSVEVSQLSRLFPSGYELGGPLRVVISSYHLQRLDKALRGIYQQRYKLLLDLSKITHTLSPQYNFENKTAGWDEDTRFSHPVEPQKGRRSGYIVRPRIPVAWKSPSSVSTSSLAQLHEKLAQLPRYDFEKEAVAVCAQPELSTVTEVSETDDRQSIASAITYKLTRPHGVIQKSLRNENKTQSDGELNTKPKVGRYLSPAPKIGESSISCLLEATVGSDESVINDTIERFSKSKDFHGDNIVDLIVKEALQGDFQCKDKLQDSGINTGDNRKTPEQENNSEAIENTPVENNEIEQKSKQGCEKTCTVISNTTTDESNDVVYETPLNFVNVRKRRKEVKEKVVIVNDTERPVFDVQEVDNFFTQHLNENQRGEVVISSTLARKINETSSESDHFDECLLNEDNNVNIDQIDIQGIITTLNVNKNLNVDDNIVHVNETEIQDIDIIECLNSMVDKVCNDLEKCAKMLSNDLDNIEVLEKAKVEKKPRSDLLLKDTTNIDKVSTNEMVKSSSKTPKRVVKLKYTAKKPAKTRANTRKKTKKLDLESVSKMSPIVEATNPTDDSSEKEKSTSSSTNNSNYLDIPVSRRRKRKLYSPKDENAEKRPTKLVLDEEEDNDFEATKVRTPNYKATSYKDIEEDRKKCLRKPRSRKSLARSEQTPSPRTKKMNDMFDNLKAKIESNESIIVADKKKEQDLAIYNFTSDSDDEDFKKKKIEVQKKMSSTITARRDSSMSTRQGRLVNRVNYSESKSSDEMKTVVLRPKRTRRKRQTKAQQINKENNLQDERMRKVTPVELNTSIILEKPVQNPIEEPPLVLAERPEMEIIPNEEHEEVAKKTKRNKKTDLSLKKDKATYKQNYEPLPREIVDDGKESPLPGLLVEKIPDKQDDINDSISVNMLQKLQKIQQGLETSANETNTTQNLLSDVEKINYSPPLMNVTEEFNKVENEAAINEVTSKKVSKVLKPTNDELIIIDDEPVIVLEPKPQKSKKTSKTQSDTKTIKVLDNSSSLEDKSDKSIATVGKSPITAHGDSNEEPPDTTHLTQGYTHRDVQIEDLDQSIQDYFNKLRDETTDIPKTSPESENSKDTVKTTKEIRSSLKEKSPVVSIYRLSYDDFSKWLPSRQNSDSESSYSEKTSENNPTVTKNSPLKEIMHDKEKPEYNRNKILMKNKLVLENIDDPILDISVKGTEMPKTHKGKKEDKAKTVINPEDSDSETTIKLQKPQKIKKRSDRILEKVQKKYKDEDRAKTVINQEESDSDTPIKLPKPQKTKKRSDRILEEVQKKYDKNRCELPSHKILKSKKDQSLSLVQQKTPIKDKINDTSQTRRSIISPIKHFEDVFKTVRVELSEDDNLSCDNGNTLTEKERKKLKNVSKKARQMKENVEVSSLDSKISTSTKIKLPENRLKRKSDSPIKEYVKRRRLQDTDSSLDSKISTSTINLVENRLLRKSDSPLQELRKTEVILSGSDRTVSSVNEWFRKTAPTDRAETVKSLLTETIHTVKEKLDTTLSEIHDNTSKKFIHMFVNAQRHLTTVKQERTQMYRTVAADILADVVKVIDAKFADLDRRSQEMDTEFMKYFKSQALELIREDCKKKQVMVSLLREDVQSVLDHMAKTQRHNY